MRKCEWSTEDLQDPVRQNTFRWRLETLATHNHTVKAIAQISWKVYHTFIYTARNDMKYICGLMSLIGTLLRGGVGSLPRWVHFDICLNFQTEIFGYRPFLFKSILKIFWMILISNWTRYVWYTALWRRRSKSGFSGFANKRITSPLNHLPVIEIQK